MKNMIYNKKGKMNILVIHLGNHIPATEILENWTNKIERFERTNQHSTIPQIFHFSVCQVYPKMTTEDHYVNTRKQDK